MKNNLSFGPSWWPLNGNDQTSTSSASASSSSSSYTVIRGARDRDLISTDEYLTDDLLDELWTWFASTAKDGVDPQLVFVKMINSIRKPYLSHLMSNSSQPPPQSHSKHGAKSNWSFH